MQHQVSNKVHVPVRGYMTGMCRILHVLGKFVIADSRQIIASAGGGELENRRLCHRLLIQLEVVD